MNHWHEEIEKNNPQDTYHGYKLNPLGHSLYIAGILNPYAYPPRNNPTMYNMFTQSYVAVNKRRGLVISQDLMYQDNTIKKITRGQNIKSSYMYCYGFNC